MLAQDTFVNVGAKDGVHEDPLYTLLLNPGDVRFSLAVEMNHEQLIRTQMPGKK